MLDGRVFFTMKLFRNKHAALITIVSVSLVALAGCGKPAPSFEYTEAQRQKYRHDADFIFEGALKKVTLITKETTVNAIEEHPDLNFAVTFTISKVEKGSFAADTFRIAVHSPTLAFQIYPSEYSKGNRKKYRIYIRSSPRGGVLTGKELIAAKN
jgi:hypothetical protein